MSGWLLSDWYRVLTYDPLNKTPGWLVAAEHIEALGFKVLLPPDRFGRNLLLVQFDVHNDPWWLIQRVPKVRLLLTSGRVKWPVAVPQKEMAVIKQELKQLAAKIAWHANKVGKGKRQEGFGYMACRRVRRRSSLRIFRTRSEMSRKRVVRLVTQAHSITF